MPVTSYDVTTRPLSSTELHIASTIGSHICHFLGYVVSIQARSFNVMGFPSFFKNIQSSLLRFSIEVGHDEFVLQFTRQSAYNFI